MSVLPLLLRPSALEQVLSYLTIEYLIVGGGGMGGDGDSTTVNLGGGGGGAGGVIAGDTAVLRGASLAVEVGRGGGFTSVGGSPVEVTAENSSLAGLVAFGGGRGGDAPGGAGASGGSGGGGAADETSPGAGGTGVAGQGENGAAGQTGGGAGGGFGGGRALSSSITGEVVTYGAGGGQSDYLTVGDQPLANSGNGGDGGGVSSQEFINVSGAGASEYNGDYFPVGTFAGSTKYRLGSTDKHIVAVDGLTWCIVTLSGETVTAIAYTLNALTLDGDGIPIPDTPPPQGPAITSGDGTEPPPSIASAIVGVLQSQVGAEGVVIIAVPGDPSATATGTYTKDTTTRPGYAVYKWTTGSGSIVFNA